MSLLNKAIQEKNREPHLAVVSFDVKGFGWVMWYRGDAFEGDIDAVGTSADDLGLTSSNGDSPDHGIWIWEGYFHGWQDYEGEWDVDVRTKEWRKPNAAEWHAIMSGRDPFDLYHFMRPEGKKITVTKPNENEDSFQKEAVAAAWQGTKSFGKIKHDDKDVIRLALIAMDRGENPYYKRAAQMLSEDRKKCPKCSGAMEKNRCAECGFCAQGTLIVHVDRCFL